MKLHWKVLAYMVAGIATGLVIKAAVPGEFTHGFKTHPSPAGLVVDSVDGPAKKASFARGEILRAVVTDQGTVDEKEAALQSDDDLERARVAAGDGGVIWFRTESGTRAVTLELNPTSMRATVVRPFVFVGDLFLALLKMLIVPLVLTSVISGVSGLGSALELRRMGLKTFAYYVASSMFAIVIGQLVVNIIRPGTGARLGLAPVGEGGVAPDASFVEVILRMVPQNVFAAMTDNGAMLSVIFFGLLFGFAITMTKEPHGRRVKDVVESVFEVMMRLAEGVLALIPYGVFALLVKAVALTGTAIFAPLALFVVTVVVALTLHAAVALPIILRVLGRVSPRAWLEAMGPALLTAFSTSSSSMTLPVTLETVEKRGGISQKVSSFTLPLGATINMDGTALYECVGVVFLAQYYASAGGFEFTLGAQALVVVMALLASIGAAGIPSAGLVMMLTILAALGLPLEGAALLLAIDRPLDMLRTAVNVWSDTVAAAVIATSEGEAVLSTTTDSPAVATSGPPSST